MRAQWDEMECSFLLSPWEWSRPAGATVTTYAPAACSTVIKARFSGVLLSHKVIDMTWEMLQVHEARLVRGQLCTPTSQHRAGPVRAIYLLTLLLLFYYFYITSTGQV